MPAPSPGHSGSQTNAARNVKRYQRKIPLWFFRAATLSLIRVAPFLRVTGRDFYFAVTKAQSRPAARAGVVTDDVKAARALGFAFPTRRV